MRSTKTHLNSRMEQKLRLMKIFYIMIKWRMSAFEISRETGYLKFGKFERQLRRMCAAGSVLW